MQDASYPFDMLSPDFVQNPVPMIDRMHAEAPVFFDPRVNGWMVGSHRVTKALEREPRLSAARSGYVTALTPPPLQARVAPLVAWYAEWMTMRDGADHRRLRQLAAHAFTPRNVDRLQERGVLRRERNPADGRSQHIVLTDKGQRLARDTAAAAAPMERELQQRLTRAEHAMLIELLCRLSGRRPPG